MPVLQLKMKRGVSSLNHLVEVQDDLFITLSVSLIKLYPYFTKCPGTFGVFKIVEVQLVL